MALDNFASELNLISNKVCNELEVLSESLDELTNAGSTMKTDSDQELELILYNNLQPCLLKFICHSESISQKRLKKLRMKEADVKKLEETEAVNQAKENRIRKLRKECESYEQKGKDLQQDRDCIQACKLLTATNFAFKKGRTMGYIVPNDKKSYEVFDYDDSKVNSQDIVKAVWNLVANVVAEDDN